jgi:hypothetical protein
MIRFLEHGQVDNAKWDAAVDAAANGIVYAKSWYLDIVSPGWQALVAGDYETIFPLTARRKFGLHYLHQPFFTQQLGAFSKQPISAAQVDQFLSAIPVRYRLVEIQLHHTNTIAENGFRVSERLTHLLDLDRPYETIQQNYSGNLKKNLARAVHHATAVTTDFKTAALVELFRSTRGKKLRTLKDGDYRTFEKLVEEGTRRSLISKIGVEHEGKLDAGAIFLRSNHEYIFLFSATGKRGKDTGAMSFIIDRFIRTHCPAPEQLDFEGSMDAGLARFYKSFGSKEVVYLQIRKNNLPLLVQWLK